MDAEIRAFHIGLGMCLVGVAGGGLTSLILFLYPNMPRKVGVGFLYLFIGLLFIGVVMTFAPNLSVRVVNSFRRHFLSGPYLLMLSGVVLFFCGLVWQATKSPDVVGADASTASQGLFAYEQTVGASFGGEGNPYPAVQLYGRLRNNNQSLRVYIEYVMANTGEIPRYNEANRQFLGEIKDKIRDEQFTLGIVYRTSEQKDLYRFWFGDPQGRKPYMFDKYLCRIVLISQENKEQHFYFMLVPQQINGMRYPDVVDIKNINLGAGWEAKSSSP